MKRTLLLAGVAALLLVAVAAGALVYMTSQASPGSTASQQAAQQFFAERGNGGTPGPFTNTMTYGGSPGGQGRPPGVVGAVTQVLGDRLVVQNPMDSTTTTVHLAADTKISKQADAQLADLTPGTHITAVGTRDGDTLTAQHVQVDDDAARPGGDAPMQITINPSGGMGTGPAPAGQGAALDAGAMTSVSGTVTQVSGNTITVKGDDGQTTSVQLAAGGQIQRQVPIQPTDIHTGDLVFASGTQQGALFEATQVEVGGGGTMQVVGAPQP